VAHLYLTEQGSVLRKTGDRIIVKKDDQVLIDVPCIKIDAVLIFGNIQFTTQAVHELFEHGIEMAILTRTGRLIGQLTSPVTKNIDLRLAQFKKYEDEMFKTSLAKEIVRGKIFNSLQMLRVFFYNHPEVDLKTEIQALARTEYDLSKKTKIEEIFGVEGIGARIYFSAFRKMILREFSFVGRKKYPPPDPINALLSLSYTMIFNEISSLLDGLGLDPYLGYYHKADYGRASLASDLIEEFRAPVADRMVLKMINNRMISGEDFYTNPKGGGIYLQREALKKYFAVYEDHIEAEFFDQQSRQKTNLRKSFRKQAEKLISTIKGETEYQCFMFNI
jgi:CRISP-associated protein Cas1